MWGALDGSGGDACLSPHIRQLPVLFMGSEDNDQFLPGPVLHHPHHALQTGTAQEAPSASLALPGCLYLFLERPGVGLGLPQIWSSTQDCSLLGTSGPLGRGPGQVSLPPIRTRVTFNPVGHLADWGVAVELGTFARGTGCSADGPAP